MNAAGKDRAAQLERKEYSLIEYRNKLVRMQNMDCICHCSGEIDMGTLLYFSVNDFYLGQGSYVVLLFSETSEVSAEQQEGRDVFGRMFTYAIIEEVAQEVLTGHHAFYSSELDGRLVMILTFPFGLMPDPTIVDYLAENCRVVTEKCRARYDMDVAVYVSEPLDDIRYITSAYTKLLETATLHRYIAYSFPSPVIRVSSPAPARAGDPFPSIEEQARELVTALLNNGDYHAAADKALDGFALGQANNIDSLKRLFGSYFEAAGMFLTRTGVKIKLDELRDSLYHILFDSVNWQEPVDWFHHLLDTVRADYSEEAHRKARRQFDEAVAYIDENLSNPNLTMEKCASGVGCSVSALSKLFRRQMNVSVARYIRDKRLASSLQLLQDGCTVGEACERCGFGSMETFHRAFKEKYGVTPGQMRGSRP